MSRHIIASSYANFFDWNRIFCLILVIISIYHKLIHFDAYSTQYIYSTMIDYIGIFKFKRIPQS